MKLTSIAGELQFVLEGDDTAEQQAFHARMQAYQLIQHGAIIAIYQRDTQQLLSHYNPCDNTQLICSAEGFPLANEFGAKRFLALLARSAVKEAQAAEVKAENFSRDRSFPLVVSTEASMAPFRAVTLAELLADAYRDKQYKLYADLADLFDRCADFIPEKQAEFQSGGRKQDKYCRFNLDSQASRHASLATEHVFLVNAANQLVGTVNATICAAPTSGLVDVYLYDEVVDYFTLINDDSATQKKLNALYADTTLSKDDKNTAIAAIVEPIRLILMAPLFAAARLQVKQTIQAMLPALTDSEWQAGIAKGTIRAFIRAADKRVASYEQLQCGTQNNDFLVIHGRPTFAAKLVDTYLKEEWAQKKLQALEAMPTNTAANLFQSAGPTATVAPAPVVEAPTLR